MLALISCEELEICFYAEYFEHLFHAVNGNIAGLILKIYLEI
jgi:hypothetical protein